MMPSSHHALWVNVVAEMWMNILRATNWRCLHASSLKLSSICVFFEWLHNHLDTSFFLLLMIKGNKNSKILIKISQIGKGRRRQTFNSICFNPDRSDAFTRTFTITGISEKNLVGERSKNIFEFYLFFIHRSFRHQPLQMNSIKTTYFPHSRFFFFPWFILSLEESWS